MTGPVLIGCDLVGTTRIVAHAGALLGERLGAPVVFFHTDAHGPLLAERFHARDLTELPRMREEYRSTALLQMRELRDRLGLEPDRVEIIAAVGPVDEQMLQAAASLSASAIVIGARGRTEKERRGAGSTALKIARAARCPVFTIDVRSPFRAPSRILFATDLDEHSAPAQRWAARLAGVFGAHLTLLHVSDMVGRLVAPYSLPPRALEDYHEALIERLESLKVALAHPVEGPAASGIETHFRISGDVAAEILETSVSGHADLIVLGTHGRRGLSRMVLGSVAEAVLHHAQMSVLTVRTE
jgi:nucleotide-binding universal stress UspA family protein